MAALAGSIVNRLRALSDQLRLYARLTEPKQREIACAEAQLTLRTRLRQPRSSASRTALT